MQPQNVKITLLPLGFKLALFLRGLSTGLLFGKRVSVRLWIALTDVGPQNRWLLWIDLKRGCSSLLYAAENNGLVKGDEVVVIERDKIRVLDTGRIMDLIAPKSMID